MRRPLIVIWLSFLLISAVIGGLLYDVFRQGERARLERSHVVLAAACTAIAARYDEHAESDPATPETNGAGRDPRGDAVVDDALLNLPGIEGGVWDPAHGFVAYGFPSYGGSSRKSDVPAAESADIEALARDALAQHQSLQRERTGPREIVLISACPLTRQPVSAAWALTRVVTAGVAYSRLTAALALLLGFVVASGLWLTWSLGRWSRRLGRVEGALGDYTPETSQRIAPTGDVELDRIVRAFNTLGERLQRARAESVALAAQVARADRLAALGRLSAGLAHEVRNPLAAMRLKTENAIAAGNPDDALTFNLRQIARLEALVRDLLATTQQLVLQPVPTAIAAWLAAHVQDLGHDADARGVSLRIDSDDFVASIDPAHLGRALDNLLRNALEHAPAQSAIDLVARQRDDTWCLRVADAGPGVPPAIRDSVFEPFVSGRASGTGLGLSIVREIVAAHGGRIDVIPAAKGACFEIVLPWHAS